MAEENEHIDYELITKFLAGEVSANEAAQVMLWREASESNSRTFSEMETLWKEAGKATPRKRAQVDVDKGWQSLNARIQTEESPKEVHKPEATIKPLYYYFSRVAALLVVGISLYWIYDLSTQPSGNVVLAAVDQVLNDTLPDGSTVSLNVSSQLTYEQSFGNSSRKVSLKGEGYFSVQHDAQKPFVVEANGTTVTVLGTSFYVQAYDSLGQITIGVKDGTVKVTTKNVEQILKAGETMIIDRSSKEIQAIEPFDPNALFWDSATLIFKNERLGIVFETLQMHYNSIIVVENKAILNCRLTARFYGEDIDQVLESISESFNLSAIKENKQYIISGSGCE